MTAPSAPTPEIFAPLTAEPPLLPVAEVDQACRTPVLFLLGAAVLWLALAATFAVMAAIKAHAPGFLAAPEWLTYGRVLPASTNAMVYGFVLQAGWAAALWMLCRLGRTLLRGGWMILAAGLFWNLGLLMGFVLILAGESTGYEWLELPGVATPILFSAYLLIGGWALVTLHLRHERNLYVSQWLLLTSLLWFPWVYSTAQLLLVFFPVRGVLQAVVGGWYRHNLFELCLAPLGLASIFYLIPKLLGRPLHSRGLALLGFWLLVFCGGWGGLRFGEPVPNWLSGVSYVGRVFLLLSLIAFGLSWFRTIAGKFAATRSDLVLRFILAGAASYLLAGALETVGAHPVINRATLFTLFDQGLAQLKLHGFLGMTLAGAIYYFAPRLTGIAWPSARLVRVHFWCAAAGVVLTVLALVIGGLVQGAGINQPQTDFLIVMRRMLPFLGTNTLGATLLWAGYVVFLVQIARLIILGWRRQPAPAAVAVKGASV